MALGQKIKAFDVYADSDFEGVFATLRKEQTEALIVATDAYFLSRRSIIVALAARYKLPTIYVAREYVVAGGFLSYGPSLTEAYRRVGAQVGRILQGEKARRIACRTDHEVRTCDQS